MYELFQPEGGVKQEQMFEVPIPAEELHCEDMDQYLLYELGPIGAWKDHWFKDFFRYGLFHSSSCCAIWCTPLSMGQTMVRARLNWFGDPHYGYGGMNHAFKIVAALYGFYVILSVALEIIDPTPPAGQEQEYNYSPGIAVFKTAIDIAFSMYSILALMKTREAIRNKYNIPADEKLGVCEDFMCAAFCSCCTVAQLSRQVNKYEEYPGVYCSESGVPNNIPTLI